ncbi:hypothetical protein IQ07DRAFT_667990 [Pyrenochaeta sp. DS3sAY3a]|nr:hypothetical protein IQ07DRAFT_667990 [Pyrenochaeta sp. DS3sAY3a]
MSVRNNAVYTGLSRNSSDNLSFTEIPVNSHDRSQNHPIESVPVASAPSLRSTPSSDDPVQRVQWRISLYTPISMVALFISGILVAMGHHLFYLRFDKSAVQSLEDGASEYLTQTWIIRYGTAFAFVAKTLLAGAIISAYRQQMWINLRYKANSVSTIDAVFAATHDILAFLSPSLLLRAKIPALMALIAWCLPLAALITPSTLLVVPSTSNTTSMLRVPTINLTDSDLYNSNGLGDNTSPLVHRITVATVTGMQVLPMNRALNADTSYQHSFDGFSLKCEQATGSRLENISTVFNETGRQVLRAANDRLSETDIKFLSFTLVEDVNSVVSYQNVTQFVSKCVMPNGETSCNSNRMPGPAIWARLGNESITCAAYNTRYTLDFQAVGTTQVITNVSFAWKDRTTHPVAISLNNALANLLNGYFGVFSGGGLDGGLFTGNTQFVDTTLLELVQRSLESLRRIVPQEDWMGAESRSFPDMIEQMSRNQTLSLFSSDKLWVPELNAAVANVSQATPITVYAYQPRNLWLAYGIAIAFSFAGVALGLRALWLNGVAHDNSFSSIMATTRNAFLDEITLGRSLGAAPTPREIAEVRLRFGEVGGRGGEKVGRAGFGVEGEVRGLEKGQVIY